MAKTPDASHFQTCDPALTEEIFVPEWVVAQREKQKALKGQSKKRKKATGLRPQTTTQEKTGNN
jgi:hypothetical protein